MRTIRLAYANLATVLATGMFQTVMAQSVTADSDQWAFTDGLNRTARDYGEAGERRTDKFVGIFYWTWHQPECHDESKRVINISKVIAEHPEAMQDYNSPYWGGSQRPDEFFWGEPLFGYYLTTDRWVLRKHAEMLADAGVDVVFFDCTNLDYIWQESFEALCETWLEAKADGVKVPKFAFTMSFDKTSEPARWAMRTLYVKYYYSGKYKDLWFYWKGKPLIMAYKDVLNVPNDFDPEIKKFFTFRPGEGQYKFGDMSFKWSWLQVYPQQAAYMDFSTGKLKYEQTSVGVAQNASDATSLCAFNLPGTYGRSYSKNNGFDQREDAYLYGWNFQEQWDRAMELDTDIVFVTGWNEWRAGMWTSAEGWSDPLSFADQFDWDHSRDCEPTADWGDKGDVYYQQLVDNIRRFKGMAPPAEVSTPKTIRLNTSGEWDDVLPRYVAYKGNTFHRDHDGYYETHYTNSTGRNDIAGAQVTHDADYVYFRVETAEDLTPSTDRNWMQLFIDADRDKSTGWCGYDFVINHASPSDAEVVVVRCVDNKWQWAVAGHAVYSAVGNVLEIAVPKSLLGMSADVDFEFKWNDNMQDEGNIMDFYVNGDTAPGGRFNYIYTSSGLTSGIDSIAGDTDGTLKAWSTDGCIHVEATGRYSVFNTTGVKVAGGYGTGKVHVATSGLYIVSDGVSTVKLSVK